MMACSAAFRATRTGSSPVRKRAHRNMPPSGYEKISRPAVSRDDMAAFRALVSFSRNFSKCSRYRPSARMVWTMASFMELLVRLLAILRRRIRAEIVGGQARNPTRSPGEIVFEKLLMKMTRCNWSRCARVGVFSSARPPKMSSSIIMKS